MTYAWIIDIDHNPDPTAKPGTNANAAGIYGPRRATDDLIEKLKAGEGRKFRMFDDDDGLYYSGRLVGDWDSEDGLGPLDDFGLPNAGCTYIQYLSDAGQYETL